MKERRGASIIDWTGALPLNRRFHAYLVAHTQALERCIQHIRQNWFSSLMTAAAVGITLSLPAGLEVVIQQVTKINASIQYTAPISLFLKMEINAFRGQQLTEHIKKMPQVLDARYIPPATALKELMDNMGIINNTYLNDDNPLPGVIVVEPRFNTQSSQTVLRQLLDELTQLPAVETAQFDFTWLHRLNALSRLVQRILWALAIFLGIGVILIVGNTIRMAIAQRQQEIEVTQMVGATNAFVRRPFLYTGLFYGIVGGGIAWALVTIALFFLDKPVKDLAELYQSHWDLLVTPQTGLKIIGFSTFLGWLGARIGVARHLRLNRPPKSDAK